LLVVVVACENATAVKLTVKRVMAKTKLRVLRLDRDMFISFVSWEESEVNNYAASKLVGIDSRAKIPLLGCGFTTAYS
jgi:hypothetical protein